MRSAGSESSGAPAGARSRTASVGPGLSSRTTALRARLLQAREERQARIEEYARQTSGCLVVLSVSIPGPDKNLPGVDPLLLMGAAKFEAAMTRHRFPCRHVPIDDASPGVPRPGNDQDDPLGPWMAYQAEGTVEAIKALCVRVEEDHPWGRLLDLDVYIASAGGPARQSGRAQGGLSPRTCLACGEPARECILLRRHSPKTLRQRTALLVESARRAWLLRGLAGALMHGARAELDLTPKPGLVDRLDSGSHPDLTYGQMRRSIDLLEVYYRELIEALECAPFAGEVRRLDESTWQLCLAAGRAAEARMFDEIGANAHRGYIFLSGLVLLSAAEAGSARPEDLRPAIARVAARFFDVGVCADSGEVEERPGQRVRRLERTGGIEAEARAGLPSVFDAAIPPLSAPDTACGAMRHEGGTFAAMAALMLLLEDTTTLHRGGRTGLERIRRDGARLSAVLSRGEDPAPLLAQWNDEYRAMGLTMGGVADCLALAIALRDARSHTGAESQRLVLHAGPW